MLKIGQLKPNTTSFKTSHSLVCPAKLPIFSRYCVTHPAKHHQSYPLNASSSPAAAAAARCLLNGKVWTAINRLTKSTDIIIWRHFNFSTSSLTPWDSHWAPLYPEWLTSRHSRFTPKVCTHNCNGFHTPPRTAQHKASSTIHSWQKSCCSADSPAEWNLCVISMGYGGFPKRCPPR